MSFSTADSSPGKLPATMSEGHPKTRRDVVKILGGFGAIALLAKCGGDQAGAAADPGTGGAGAGGGPGVPGGSGGGSATGKGGGPGGAGGQPSPSGGAGGASTAEVPWATEGTSVLVDKDYGNPFAAGTGAVCAVFKKSTGGPCHATSDKLSRRDISEGYPGVPMRLELLVVDTSCAPVPNATVEVWHTNTYGIYSGDTDGEQDDFCTTGDPEAKAALWYRGIQTAGDDGRVTFDTNFPGWYGGRANHIHFRVTVDGTSYLISQLFFDETLNQEIYDSQPNYKKTSSPKYQGNVGDVVVTSAGLTISDVVMTTAKQSDGALLAWKAIAIQT